MHQNQNFPFRGVFAAFLGALAVSPAQTVDGNRNTAVETDYVERTVQVNTNANTNVLANLHTAVSGANLRVFLGGRASGGNAVLLFIDSKPGGVPEDGGGAYIPSNLITTGDLPEAINQLGVSTTNGLRFESGFRPDYAVRIQGNGNQALVHRYDLAAGIGRALPGDAGTSGALRAGGFISGARVWWQDVNVAPVEVDKGVELSLNLPLMGASAGTHTVRMLAILVNADSISATNQTLASLNPPAIPPRADIGIAGNFSFETEPGVQTISFDVTHAVIDSDGDGLADASETNDGMYLSASATGSNPLVADTDGDGQPDGSEVSGTAFGFLTNPNVPNYPSVWAPGNFTSPQFTPNASTLMVRAGNDLTGQYQWSKLYRIQSVGTVNFKLTAGGSPAVNWGPGSTPGTVLANNSNNFSGGTPATGFYQIDFDQAALTWNFGRKVFATQQDFLTAYGLASGADGDGDGIANQNEYAGNTDPTNADSDQDGINDSLDPNPLLAVRDIVFRVDMSVQQGLGEFNPALQAVRVQFFDGVAAPGELALVSAGNGIYTGTLAAVQGSTGLPFGAYKFAIVPIGGGTPFFEDQILSRNFNLGTAHQNQVLPVVFFNDNAGSGTPGYSAWAETFSEHPGGPTEDFDGDGFTNNEEYLYGTPPDEATASLVRMETNGIYIDIYYNEREDGSILMEPQQSPDLSPESWVFPDSADFFESPDQTGVQDGCIRVYARIPMTEERMFFRVKAQEAPPGS